MTIASVTCLDMFNPVELQAWLDAHTGAAIAQVLLKDNTFYVFYT